MNVLPVQSCVDMNSSSLSKVKLELVSFKKYFFYIYAILKKKTTHLNADHDRQLHLRCKKNSGTVKVST